jgi:hypothetical protein
VFGTVTLLVEWGVFLEVELLFLVVGHTHNDQGGTFRVLAGYTPTKEYATVGEFVGTLKDCYSSVVTSGAKKKGSRVTTPPPVGETGNALDTLVLEDPETELRVYKIFEEARATVDLKDALEPLLRPGLAYHTRPHSFLFTRGKDSGVVVVQYKNWPQDEVWQPPKERVTSVLRDDVPVPEPKDFFRNRAATREGWLGESGGRQQLVESTTKAFNHSVFKEVSQKVEGP